MNLDSKTLVQKLLTERHQRDIGEFLRELYIDRRWTDQEIGDHFGVSRSAIKDWRRQYGIDRADRKAALA